MKYLPLAVNLVAYQLAWFACVFAAARGQPMVGLAVAVAVVGWHLHTAREPRRELMLILIAIALGGVFESVLVASGWARSNDAWVIGGSTPVLMVALWGAFATTLNVAWRALRERLLVCAVIAAVGAPLAYQAGVEIGALRWVSAGPALVLISLAWGVLLPVLLRAARHFDGFART